MKKFTKALAAVILVAIVVGVFASLSVFAAEADATAYGTIVYEMDAVTATKYDVKSGTSGCMPTMKKNDDGIWEWSYPTTVNPAKRR